MMFANTREAAAYVEEERAARAAETNAQQGEEQNDLSRPPAFMEEPRDPLSRDIFDVWITS